MSREAAKTNKLLTIDQAQAMLPLVRSIVADIQELEQETRLRARDLNRAVGLRRRSSEGLYDDEVAESRHDLNEDQSRLAKYVSELTALGVRLVSATQGHVEFPVAQENRVVYLCWKPSENHIEHWRESEETFSERHELPIRVLASN